MYKLMLVDDEEDVREGVVQEIDWAAIGFEIIGKAENGQEALELMERLLPDIIVTDIKMPFMDGLTLSEQIREKYPATKIIILSGFDEFEYAQKALKLQVDEYLLKPFSSQELVQVLLKAKSRIDEETAQKENVEILREHYRKSLPVLKEIFLASLLTRRLGKREIEEKCQYYNIDIGGNEYVVSVLSMDHIVLDPQTRILQSGSLRDSDDQELKRYAVFNIVEEIVDKHQVGKVFIHNDYVVLLTIDVAAALNDRTLLNRTLTVLEEIRQSVERYLKFSVTIGVGTVINELPDVSYSYKDAVLALDYRVILGGNRVICIDDVETRYAEKVRFDEIKEHALIRCIKVGTVNELKDIVVELFDGIADESVSVKDYQIFLLEVLTSILKAAKDAGLNLDDVFGENFVLFAEVQKFQQLQEAKDWIVTVCIRMMKSIATDRQSSYKSLVEEAKNYTRQHYHDPDISIQKLCGHLHISAGYFSNIFKKEVKMTYLNYLMHIRMEHAKELLRTTDLKAFEIAEKVGYSEPNYFSFSFRKYVGVSPKEYRSDPRTS